MISKKYVSDLTYSDRNYTETLQYFIKYKGFIYSHGSDFNERYKFVCVRLINILEIKRN